MKNTSFKFILLMSMFFSTPVHGMVVLLTRSTQQLIKSYQ